MRAKELLREHSRRYCEVMELHSRPNADGAWIVTLLGELDLAAVPSFRSATTEALRDGWTHMVIDLEHVSFIDSAGIGVLIGLRRRVLAADGSLTLRASKAVDDLLTVAEVNSLFTVVSLRCES